VKEIDPEFYDFMDLSEKNITVEYIGSVIDDIEKGQENDPKVFKEMKNKRYDIIGIRENGRIFQYLKLNGDVEDIQLENIIADSTPLTNLTKIFSENINRKIFVLNKEEIKYIITKADLQKGPYCLFLFGLIVNFEITSREFIKQIYDDTWENKLSDNKLDDINDRFEDLKEKNQDIDKLHCTYLSELKPILFKTKQFLSLCEKLNLSRTKAKDLFDHVSILRNNLAHSRKSEDTIKDWKKILNIAQKIPQITSEMRKEIKKRNPRYQKNSKV